MNETNKKPIFIGIGVVAVIAVIVALFATGIIGGKPKDKVILGYGNTFTKAFDQFNKEFYEPRVKASMEYKEQTASLKVTDIALPGTNAMVTDMLKSISLDMDYKDDPTNKKLQMGIDVGFNGKDIDVAKMEINDEEFLVDLNDVYGKILMFPSKTFGQALYDYQIENGMEADESMKDLDMSYTEIMSAYSQELIDGETILKFKEAIDAFLLDVEVTNEGNMYSFVVPNENFRTGIKKLYEATYNIPMIKNNQGGASIETILEDIYNAIDTDPAVYEVETNLEIDKNIVLNSDILIKADGEQASRIVSKIGDQEKILNDIEFDIKGNDDTTMVKLSNKGTVSADAIDTVFTVDAGGEADFVMNMKSGAPFKPGAISLSVVGNAGGQELMNMVLSGNYSQEGEDLIFKTDKAEISMISNGAMKIGFDMESKMSKKVEEYYAFDKEKVDFLSSTVETQNGIISEIMQNFLPLLGLN